MTAVTDSSTSITVRWNEVPPIDHNGVITYYELRYEPLESFGGVVRSRLFWRTVMSFVLRNLEEFVEYNISVRALNSAGWGPYSSGTTITTQQDGSKLHLIYNP